MRISLNWLNDYINIANLEIEKVAEALTGIGLEVESIEKVASITGEVVVGKILETKKHPDADKLKVCKVDIGKGALLDIVCGAANARDGLIVCVATVGSVLPGEFKIKKSKIRGVESNGMLCAEDELGLGAGHEGIIELDRSEPLGRSVADLYKLNDTVLTLNLTPNRADCLSYIGVARDLSAKLGIPLNVEAIEHVKPTTSTQNAGVQIEVQNAEDCPRFCALHVSDVEATPSPSWMQKRLTAAGMRPINLIVDVTNYVMLEFGQPIHAYDERFVKDKKFVVRNAKAGETMKTLDAQERKLDPNDLLICDAKGPIGLAGVMGAENSEVKDDTKAIIVEVANFSPSKIRKTAKRLGLHTEASHRFERGVDMTKADIVAYRVASLLQSASKELAKTKPELKIPQATGSLVECYPVKPKLGRIALRLSRCKQILGLASLEEKRVISSLTALQFKQIDRADDRLLFEIPSWRSDIMREIDLIEEVGRLIGFNEIPYQLPVMEIGALAEDPFIKFLDDARTTMAQSGFTEIISFPFVAAADLTKFNLNKSSAVELVNPLAEELAVMQPTLLIGLTKAVVENERHGQTGVKLFECGRGYTSTPLAGGKGRHLTEKAQGEERPAEINYISGILAQPYLPKGWQSPELKADFFHAKALIDAWLKSFGLTSVTYTQVDQNEVPYLHPGASAKLSFKDCDLGYIGVMNPKTAQSYGLDPGCPPVAFEMNAEKLFQAKSEKQTYDTTERKFPPVSRDLALVVDRSLRHAQLSTAIQKFPRKRNLKEFRLFDVYQGDKVAADKKSLAYALAFQSPKRTLNDQEVDGEIAQLLEWLNKETGATLR